MADTEEFDIDPAIAEAMGFSSFGMQAKKRKFDHNDGFVDSAAAKPENQTESNITAIRVRPAGVDGPTSAQHPHGEHGVQQAATDEITVATAAADGNSEKPTLEQLRRGVKSDQGDTVYFLPSFIEDPWKDIRPR